MTNPTRKDVVNQGNWSLSIEWLRLEGFAIVAKCKQYDKVFNLCHFLLPKYKVAYGINSSTTLLLGT